MSKTNNLSSKDWVIISGIGFILSFAFFLLLFFIPGLNQVFIRLQGLVFYIILIPFALLCAGFLFGALRSYAKASGKNIHGTLKLGGPVVVFVIVLWGGLQYHTVIATNDYFICTIQFYSDDEEKQLLTGGSARINTSGIPPVPLKFENGYLTVQLPNEVIEKKLEIIPDVQGYSSKPLFYSIPEDKVLRVYLKPKKYRSIVYGHVYDGDNKLLNEEHIIEWGGVRDTLDMGYYKLEIPYAVETEENLKIIRNGEILYSINQAIPEGQHDIKIN